jgi:hypothetical protein
MVGYWFDTQIGYCIGDRPSQWAKAVPERPDDTYDLDTATLTWVATPATAAAQAQAQYNAAIAAGVVVTSTSTPAFNGTYSISDTAQSNIQANQTSILTNGKFTNGQTTRAWLDINGTPHTFQSTAVFTSFAEAVGAYVDALIIQLGVAQSGGTPTWPSNAVTIP